MTLKWNKEPGVRIQGSRPEDNAKLLAPCIAHKPDGGYRMIYTAVGPAKPFDACQGYLLSAVSDDGLHFEPEPGIRLAPREELPHLCIRALCADIVELEDGRWRIYFEARGGRQPYVVCSAISSDMLHWELEEGIRLQPPGGAGGPRYLSLPDGRSRLYYCTAPKLADGSSAKSVASAVSDDGLHFETEPDFRLRWEDAGDNPSGITTAEVIPPKWDGDCWTMYYSPWEHIPAGSGPYPKPDFNPDALADEFVTASITTDISGFRSRIRVAYSDDGLSFAGNDVVVEGGGYDSDDLEAIHAEDMSLIEIAPDRYRMYYAACDRRGNWRLASAVSGPAVA